MKTRSHAKSVQKGGSVQTGCGGDDSDTDEVPVAKLNKTRSGKMESSSAASKKKASKKKAPSTASKKKASSTNKTRSSKLTTTDDEDMSVLNSKASAEAAAEELESEPESKSESESELESKSESKSQDTTKENRPKPTKNKGGGKQVSISSPLSTEATMSKRRLPINEKNLSTIEETARNEAQPSTPKKSETQTPPGPPSARETASSVPIEEEHHQVASILFNMPTNHIPNHLDFFEKLLTFDGADKPKPERMNQLTMDTAERIKHLRVDGTEKYLANVFLAFVRRADLPPCSVIRINQPIKTQRSWTQKIAADCIYCYMNQSQTTKNGDICKGPNAIRDSIEISLEHKLLALYFYKKYVEKPLHELDKAAQERFVGMPFRDFWEKITAVNLECWITNTRRKFEKHGSYKVLLDDGSKDTTSTNGVFRPLLVSLGELHPTIFEPMDVAAGRLTKKKEVSKRGGRANFKNRKGGRKRKRETDPVEEEFDDEEDELDDDDDDDDEEEE